MSAPKGLFTDRDVFTLAVLNAMITSAQQRIVDGDYTSMSGAEKSHSKQWSLPPDQVLIEANYAKRRLQGIPRVSKLNVNFSGNRHPNRNIFP